MAEAAHASQLRQAFQRGRDERAKGDPDVKGAALIATAQRVEHYKISGYGTARIFALRLDRQDAADLLQQTLREESETDKN